MGAGMLLRKREIRTITLIIEAQRRQIEIFHAELAAQIRALVRVARETDEQFRVAQIYQ